MAVQAVALPKANKRMPDRATRTPDPPKGDAPTAKAPPPPKTASDMALRKKKAEKKKGATNRSTDRADLLNKIRRQELLKDARAALGSKDRVETDKDGVEPDEAVIGPSGVGRVDPELALYQQRCRKRILQNLQTMPAVVAANPNFQILIAVKIDADGVFVGPPRITKSSNDPSLDRSAEIAVIRTGSCPSPPASYGFSQLTFELADNDLR